MISQEDLKIISDCPVCGLKNFPAKIKLLQENSQMHLLHVQCRKCSSKMIVFITFGLGKMASVGLLTLLDENEVLKFGRSKKIYANEVLELYENTIKNNKSIFDFVK